MPGLWVSVWSVLVPAEHSTFFISASGMVEPQDRNSYCVQGLRIFNFDFWFVAPGSVSAGRGLSTGTAAATAPSAFAAPKFGGPGRSPGWGAQAVWGPAGGTLPLLHPSLPAGDQAQVPPGLSSHEHSEGGELVPGTCGLKWQSQEPQISSGKPLPPSAPQSSFSPAGGWMVWFLLGGGFWGVLMGFFARSFSA